MKCEQLVGTKRRRNGYPIPFHNCNAEASEKIGEKYYCEEHVVWVTEGKNFEKTVDKSSGI